MRLLSSLLLSCALAIPCASVAGEIYRWVDAEGNVHFSETPPASAHAREWEKPDDGRVTIFERDRPPLSTPPAPQQDRTPPPASPQTSRQSDKPEKIAGKYEWQWRKEARSLETKVESLEEQLESAKDSSLSGFPSSMASARFDARKQERIERLEGQIEAAEDRLELFEDDARQSGVPPGWLR